MCSTLRSSILASIAFWLLTLAPSLADRPNIVLILADDMGWSDPGCYGSEIPTPALDTLARQGMLATRLYTASRCSPSRASIMTGCEPHKVDVGLLDDDSGHPGYRGRLNPDIPTLPELLKKAGYRTYLSGKWHLGKVQGAYPWDRGFDRSRGLLGGAADYYRPMPDRPFGENGKLLRPEDLPEDFYMTDDITKTALAYIDDAAKSRQPFFLYVAYTAPHTPLQAPRREIEKCSRSTTANPPMPSLPKDWKNKSCWESSLLQPNWAWPANSIQKAMEKLPQSGRIILPNAWPPTPLKSLSWTAA